jgi:hypothetical protein
MRRTLRARTHTAGLVQGFEKHSAGMEQGAESHAAKVEQMKAKPRLGRASHEPGMTFAALR